MARGQFVGFPKGTKVVITEEAEASIHGMHGTVKHWSSKSNSAVELYQGEKWIGTKRIPNKHLKAV